MVYNFHRLSNTSMSIAITIISLIFSVLFLFLGFKYDSNVLAGFILMSFSCILLAASSIVSFVKARKYGNENLNKLNPSEKIEDKSTFKLLTTLISCFTICFVLFFVVGVIVMLA